MPGSTGTLTISITNSGKTTIMNLRACILCPFVLTFVLGAQQVHQASANRITVDASAVPASPETGYLHLGGTSSTGHSLQVNSQYLVLDNQPWLPVMGEFHFSRYPEAQWEEEILKMQAAGVTIVSTYIFWIHHEEIEGQFDWSGQRDLRRFVQLCAKHNMYVWLRIGPWAHGEVRNGGFPDWIAALPNNRTNDPTYIQYVERFYNQIGLQVHDLMFKDGGPVIGTQLENEYGLHGPGRGSEHILKLKQLALAAGIDTPLYSVTGWPSLDFPPQEVIPVSGGYPDGFWYNSRTNLPPSMTYLFNFNRELGDMGATVPSEDPTGKVNLKHDPYFAAEEAGGMASAYHRRPVISADDIAALTLAGIGSGVNLYGYYMFHGGANPAGKRSTLQESTATGYPNDLPEITYDFGAPLGEFGQQRESYRKTRMLHLFLNAFGPQLATMPAYAPAQRSRDAANTAIPRVAVRTDGKSGFLFVNNYVRQLPMPARTGFQVEVKLPASTIVLPAHPMDIPANSYFAWPFNLSLGTARLKYATAQLMTQIETDSGKVFAFFAIPGVEPEFCFDTASVSNVSSPGSVISHSGGSTLIRKLVPGMKTTIQFTDASGTHITLLLLTQEQAENLAQLRAGGAERLVVSSSATFFDGQALHLQATSPTQHYAMLAADGSGWESYTLTQPEKHFAVAVTQTSIGKRPSQMTMGPYVDWRKSAVPVVPPDSAFDSAATWQIEWKNPDLAGLSEALLQIDYSGDIGRLKSGTDLLDDNFFHGLPWQVGLKRFLPSPSENPKAAFTLQILGLPPRAPIYLEKKARALAAAAAPVRIRLLPVYESTTTIH